MKVYHVLEAQEVVMPEGDCTIILRPVIQVIGWEWEVLDRTGQNPAESGEEKDFTNALGQARIVRYSWEHK